MKQPSFAISSRPAKGMGLALLLCLGFLPLPAWPQDVQSKEVRTLHLNDLAGVLRVPTILSLSKSKEPTTDIEEAMSLQMATQRGLSNSLDVQASGFKLEGAVQNSHAARGALLLKVDVKLGYGKGRLESADPNETLARREGTLTVRQALFDETARREWQRQGVLTQSAQIQLEGTQSSSALEISTAYLQALQSRLVIEVSQDYEALLADFLRYIEARAEGGGASNADRDRVRARVASARASIADARSGAQVARRNLERLVGSPVSALMVAGPDSFGIPMDIESAQELLRAQNHDLRAARADLEAAGIERKGLKGAFLPKLSLELTHQRNTNAGGTSSYFQETKGMVLLSMPILNGGTDMAQISAAKARAEEQRLKALNTERKLLQELESAYANLDALSERYKSMREELAANQSVVNAFKEQLTSSNRTLLDVLDAYQRLYQSKLDMTQLLVGETQFQTKVAHLTGTLTPTLTSSGLATK